MEKIIKPEIGFHFTKEIFMIQKERLLESWLPIWEVGEKKKSIIVIFL